MTNRTRNTRWIPLFAGWLFAASCGAVEYRYPAELPVKQLKIEMEERYYGAALAHIGTMHVHRLSDKQITRDSQPFTSIKLHVRDSDGSDLQFEATANTWTETKKRLDPELSAVCLRWSPDIPSAEAGASFPCYISFEDGEKKWATREFSLKIGGRGKHMKCDRCFSIGPAPKVTLSEITGRRMENLSGGTNTTFIRGSMERNIAGRMEAMSGKTNTAVRVNTLQHDVTNRMHALMSGGAQEGKAGSLEQSVANRMNVLRGGGQHDGKTGSLERSAYSRTQSMLLSRDRQKPVARLEKGIAVYSLEALPQAQVTGRVPSGTVVQFVSEINPALVHIRFPLSGGEIGEGVARYAELGVKRMAGMRKVISLPNGEALSFVWCPAGRFMMGSPLWEDSRNGDEPQHGVVLSHGFWMGQFEVTHEQWESVMDPKDVSSGPGVGTIVPVARGGWQENGLDPTAPDGWAFDNGSSGEEVMWVETATSPSELSYGRSSEKGIPVTGVDWNECRTFCQRLNAAAGLKLRLPTEAEWEYACRAGSSGACSGTGTLAEMAWFRENSYGKVHPTGLKKPNDWGLYDMQGNVSEWCADGYASYPSPVATDPHGKPDATSRVARGGSYVDDAAKVRVARRVASPPARTTPYRGFRVVMVE